MVHISITQLFVWLPTPTVIHSAYIILLYYSVASVGQSHSYVQLSSLHKTQRIQLHCAENVMYAGKFSAYFIQFLIYCVAYVLCCPSFVIYLVHFVYHYFLLLCLNQDAKLSQTIFKGRRNTNTNYGRERFVSWLRWNIISVK